MRNSNENLDISCELFLPRLISFELLLPTQTTKPTKYLQYEFFLLHKLLLNICWVIAAKYIFKCNSTSSENITAMKARSERIGNYYSEYVSSRKKKVG